LMSGWSIHDGDERRRIFDFFIQKPFEKKQLEALVARAIELRDMRTMASATEEEML